MPPELAHANRISKERTPSTSGKQVGDFLLEEFKRKYGESFPFNGNGTATPANQYKWRMFCEIVMHNAFDIAGNRHVRATDGTQFSAFDTVFHELKEQRGIEGEAAFNLVLSHLPSYSKGLVQTPHPTEVLPIPAIEAEHALHMELEHNLKLFSNGNPGQNIGQDDLNHLLTQMKTLYDAMTPLQKQLTPGKEMARSVLFSETMFDSVPIAVQAILDAARRHDAYDGRPLSREQLMAFNFLLQPETWSPGDRDSKSEMTAENLERGIELNQKSMALHYLKNLADIIVDPNTPDTVVDAMKPYPVKAQLREVMWKIIQNINPASVEKYLTEQQGKLSEKIVSEIRQMNDQRYRNASAALLQGLGVDSEEPAYNNMREFIADLEAIRETPGARFPTYEFASRNHSALSKLDALIIQANNFGRSALRSQIRENAEMHSHVMDIIVKKLIDRNIPKLASGQDRRARVDTALEMLMNEKKYPGMGKRIHQILCEEIDHVKETVKSAQDKKKNGDALTANEKNTVDFYETLKGFEIAATHPEAIPRYLIAECKSTEDILEAFFMLKAMEPDDTRNHYRTDKGAVLPKVGVIPLVEYRKNVEQIGDIMVSAYKNPYFREHHNSLTGPGDPIISKPATRPDLVQPITANDPLGMQKTVMLEKSLPLPQPMSVADAKRMYQMEIKPGDEEKTVQAAKIVMFAGSDITKSVGCAGAGLVMHASNRLREQMLDMEEPVLLVDYTGSGGGLHRSQPVTTAYETVQGRSMRQSDLNIAQKILMLAGNYLLKIFGLDTRKRHLSEEERKRDQVLTAQLNVGNVAGLTFSEDTWKKHTEQRLNADMDMYEDLYRDPAYAAFMGFTSDPFVKLTSYAARAAARVGARDAKDEFPPLVDVKNLRAIGYGAALNGSGSCMSYYYGASAFLGLDKDGHIPEENRAELVDLYLNDPVTQDRLNRASYGIVMANMDQAWDYVGMKRINDHGNIILESAEGRFDCASLAHETDDVRRARRHVQDGTINAQEKSLLAVHQLAKIDVEFQQVSRGLLELNHALKSHAGMAIKTPGEAREVAKELQKLTNERLTGEQQQLLAEMPVALREQLIESRKQFDPARAYMSQLFKDITGKARQSVPTREDSEFEKIYYAMGAVFECFENIPRAYMRHEWAATQERQQGHSLSA